MKKSNLGILAMSLFLAATGAYADNATSTGTPPPHPMHAPGGPGMSDEMKEVAQACAKSVHVTLPAGGGQQMSAPDREKMKGCFMQFGQTMQSCTQAAGLPKITGPEAWKNLTDAQKASVKICKTQAMAKINTGA